jgi:hypothetical protein
MPHEYKSIPDSLVKPEGEEMSVKRYDVMSYSLNAWVRSAVEKAAAEVEAAQ